jgi:hypothetical protein
MFVNLVLVNLNKRITKELKDNKRITKNYMFYFLTKELEKNKRRPKEEQKKNKRRTNAYLNNGTC